MHADQTADGGGRGFEVRGLGLCLENKRLLNEISFELAPGSRTAIIGPNGAGKSTLLRALCGLVPYQQGSLRLDGQPCERWSVRERARRIAYVPQLQVVSEGYSVREFVRLGRYAHVAPWGAFAARDEQAAETALEQAGLGPLAERRLDRLSGGERQRVMIAAALAQESRVLLLDEPAAFLDPYQQHEVYTLLDRLGHQAGIIRLEVTHDVNRAAGHDRVLGLRDGRLVFAGTPEALMRDATLAQIYGHRFCFARHPRTGRPIALLESEA